jgi:Domain of unknown function (DUF4389)
LNATDAAPTSTTTAITIDFPSRRSRLTTLFRLILAIPLAIFGYFYGIVALLAVIITWFVMIVTGRYPAGLFSFVSGYVRFQLRYSAYAFLLVDAYPPFSGGEYPAYPVHVLIPERKAKYSRLKAFFRFIYVIPAYIVVVVLMIVFLVLDVLAWFIILIAGRLPGFIERYMAFTFGWLLKYQSLYFLLIENY